MPPILRSDIILALIDDNFSLSLLFSCKVCYKDITYHLFAFLCELFFAFHLGDAKKLALEAYTVDLFANHLRRHFFVMKHMSFECTKHFVRQQHD
jgi:hypothetical protein